LIDVEPAERLFGLPVVRVLCKDLPQYMALVSRVRVDSRILGPAGGVLSSSVLPLAQVVFPPDAIVKPINIGLQVTQTACLLVVVVVVVVVVAVVVVNSRAGVTCVPVIFS